MNLFALMAAFGAGIFGALFGGVPTFVMTGLIALAGGAAAMTGASDVAAGALAFGSVFGPHISFSAAATAAAYAWKRGYRESDGTDILSSLNGTSKADVLLVAGFTGLAGYTINWLYASVLCLNTDTISMTVATVGVVGRLLFGTTGLTGKYEKGEKRHILTPGMKFYNLIMGLGVGIMVGGVGMYMIHTYPDQVQYIKAYYPSTFFAISAITLVLCLTSAGASVPATHHITITCANAIMLTENIWIAAAVGIIAALMGDLVANVFNSHNDTHIDPPATAITIVSFVLFALFK